MSSTGSITEAPETASSLKAYAREIGLAGLAIGPAAHLAEAEEHLRERIAAGFLGEYGLTAGCEERFTHPERLLDGARTLICCALPYLRPVEASPHSAGGLTGLVARFARGRDYHKALHEKLTLIAGRLQELVPGSGALILHDTGPLLDRAAALASGLGWFGRNACIIVPDYGSWVVLGEIITDAALPVDPPLETDRCGSCGLCMAACPNEAIAAPGQVNIHRCISHLTQMSGIILRPLRRSMGRMIYGCDICQEVCPQNAGALPGNPADFEPGPMHAAPGLIALLQMSKAEYAATLRHGAAGWIGRNRLRRNACIALGNLKDASSVPALARALLRDRSPMVRAHAAWALGEIGGEEARDALRLAKRHETDPDVTGEIDAALGGG
jgi:epoxyqueuosine reductase